MYIFAEPMSEEAVDAIQTKTKDRVEEWEREILRQPLLRSDNTLTRNPVDVEPPQESQVDEDLDNVARTNVEQDVTSELIEEDINESDRAEGMNGPQSVRSREKILESTGQPDASSPEPTQSGAAAKAGADLDSPQAESSQQKELYNEQIETDSPTINNEKPMDDTHSPADIDFIEKFEAPESRGPVLGMVLSISSTINGNSVQRPTNITKKDKWDVRYTLVEMKSSRVWSLYDALKARRAKELDRDREEESEYRNSFRQNLLNLAQKGRKWRKKVEAEEAAEGKAGAVRMWNESAGPREEQRTPAGRPTHPLYKDERQEEAGLRRVLEGATQQARHTLSKSYPGAVALLDEKVSSETSRRRYEKLAATDLDMTTTNTRNLEVLVANRMMSTIVKEIIGEQRERDSQQESASSETAKDLFDVESGKD